MLANATQLIHGPITEYGLAIDEALVHGTKVATIIRHRPVIAEDIVGIRRNHCLRKGSRIRVLGGNVTLIQGLAIYVDLSPIDPDAISGHPDHALDVALRRIVRITKNHDVATFYRLEPVNELIDEDPLLVHE